MNQEVNMEEIIDDHDKADTYISLVLLFLDIIIYFVTLFLFGCFNREFFSIKQNISFLIILDICIRIVNIFYTSFIYSIFKEILFSTFASYQFYLIITIFNQIFKENSIGSPLEKVEIKYPFLSSIFFFIFAIIIDIHKIASLVQYGCAIAAIIFYALHVKKRVELFLTHLEKKKSDYFAKNFLHNIIIFLALYYIIYFGMRILDVIIENTLYHSYSEIAMDVFKELTKYFSFSMVIYFYYLDNKYLKEKEEEKKNNQNKEESNQNNKTDQTDQTNQTNQTNQSNQSNKPKKSIFGRFLSNQKKESSESNGSSPNTSTLNFTSVGSSSLPL